MLEAFCAFLIVINKKENKYIKYKNNIKAILLVVS